MSKEASKEKGAPKLLKGDQAFPQLTDEQIAKAPEEITGKTEMEAMIAYLQSLGLALRDKRS